MSTKKKKKEKPLGFFLTRASDRTETVFYSLRKINNTARSQTETRVVVSAHNNISPTQMKFFLSVSLFKNSLFYQISGRKT